MRLIKVISKVFWTVLGLVLVAALPGLFHGTSLNIPDYFKEIVLVLEKVIHPGHLVYTNPVSGMKLDLFPEIFRPYTYSLEVFIISFFLSLIVALLLASLVVFLRKKQIQVIAFIGFIFESLPDVAIIIAFQLFVVWYYQRTHVLLMDTASFGENHAFIMPILCLSVLPTVLFFRIILPILEEELTEDYVELAKSKGVGMRAIVFVHVLRNALVAIQAHSTSILWMMLPNLVMLEFLFNMYGITQFVLTYYTPSILLIGILLLFLPIFLIQMIGALIVGKMTGKGAEM